MTQALVRATGVRRRRGRLVMPGGPSWRSFAGIPRVRGAKSSACYRREPHIRQQTSLRMPGIIMPAVPGASEEVWGKARVVITVSKPECDGMCQFVARTGRAVVRITFRSTGCYGRFPGESAF